jgi:hypothetical protein
MSLPRSQLVAEVLEYCGSPPDVPLRDGGLPQPLVFQVLIECEDEMLRDLDLSTQNRRVGMWEDTLSDAEFSPSIDGNPSYAAVLLDSASDVWMPVEIVNHSALAQAMIDGRMAIAFRDTPSIAEVSWTPESSHTLRIWYDRSGSDAPELASSTEIGSLYDSYLKLRAAAQCRELMSLDVGKVLSTRLINSERQWGRYVDMGRQQGVGFKNPVYTPRRFRRAYPFLDRTRFFVP